MKFGKTHLTPAFELCEEKAAEAMRRIAALKDLSKGTLTVSRIFEHGVLTENTSNFLRLLIEEELDGKRKEPELQPDELQALLTDAYTKTYLYLLTPQSFIPEYLSFGSDTIHINVKTLSRLDSLCDYPYFPDILREWLTITSQTIAAEDRKLIIRKFLSDTERIIIHYSPEPIVEGYLSSLYEYHGSELINRETAEIFFSDKGLPFPGEDEKKEFSIGELSALLKRAYFEAEVTPPAEALAPIPKYDSFLQELREIGVILPAPHPRNSPEGKKILPPLEMFIGSKLRKKCLEKIFHHNENEYRYSIKLLNDIDDYHQAELSLITLLQIHKVAQDSKVALRLKEALQLRFGLTPLQEQTQ